MLDYAEIGKRISQKRKALGLTQFEVCEKCGISDKYLSNIERTRSIPSLDVIIRICEVLETTPDYILLGTNKSETNDVLIQTKSLLNLLSENQLLLLNDFIKLLVDHGEIKK